MTSLRIYLTLILYLSISIIGISQEIESYKLSIDATYLPTVSYNSEYFSKKKNKLMHEARFDGKKKTLEKKDVLNIILQIDSLSKVDSFNFYVDESLIDEMKNKYTYYKKENGISNSDIETLFDENNMVSLDTKKIKSHLLEAISGQIDGAYYSIKIELKFKNNKKIDHGFEVQSSGPKSHKIKDWLILYSVFQNENVFETIPLKESCFSQSDFIGILFRFILLKK